VLGAYLVLFPQAKVRALIPFGYVSTISYVPAIFMIGIWFLTQLASVFLSEQAGGGVAFFAHIGGFIVGLVLAFLLRSRDSAAPIFSR
jgi:membrane associated rhomboid family serine protease